MGTCSRPITSFLNVRLTWTYGCYYSKHILDVKCLFRGSNIWIVT